MRVNLAVPYSQKDDARKAGAQWDSARRLWFIEDAEDLRPFLRWMPKHLTQPHKERAAA